MHFVQRQHAQIPFGGGRIARDFKVLMERCKTRHVDLNGPGTVRKIGERICAFGIGDRGEDFASLGSGHGGAGDRQAAEFYLSMVLTRAEQKGGERGDGEVSQTIEDGLAGHRTTNLSRG